jgi:pimeloyl-ACP methyl ester carboxylesterase
MKSKAETMWLPDEPGSNGLDQHAGRYLLTQLKAYADETPGVTVDLVGHSAGTIAICHFIRQFLAMEIKAKVCNIIFLAPACRSDLFHATIGQNLAAFANFRMFTMSDIYETQDRCVPFIYTRSLLYMISGILEKDEFDAYILGMERYLKGNPPYHADPMLLSNIQFMSGGTNRVVYAKTAAGAGPGLQCEAVHHGDFHDEQFLTMDSIVYILNNSPCQTTEISH